MEISPFLLATLTLCSFLFGVAIGIVIDFSKLTRIFLIDQNEKHYNLILNIVINIRDFCAVIIYGIGIILLNYYYNDGRIRLFSILSSLVGLIIYRLTLSKIILKIFKPIVLLIKKIIKKLLYYLSKPILVLIKSIVILLKFLYSKIKNHIEKKNKLRYNYNEMQRLIKLSKQGFYLPILRNKNENEF